MALEDPDRGAGDDWSRALTLAERARAARLLPATFFREVPAPSRGRIDPWKRQAPFDHDDWMARRLALDGLDEEGFGRLLAVPPADIAARLEAPPGWMVELSSAFAEPRRGDAALQDDPSHGFLEWARPLVSRATSRLREGAARIAADRGALSVLPEDGARLFAGSIPTRLLSILDRTLVLELNVARVEGRLEGATPEDRFRSFVERLGRRDVALSIAREYPVLARAVVESLERWRAASVEFLERLATDWPRIVETFFPDADPGRLVAVEGDAGDPHRGGRAVLIAVFSSGRRIVYKPRPLAVDAHFQEFLAWLAASDGAGDGASDGAHETLRTVRVLDRGRYGWMEHVAAAGCGTEEDVRRYHRRLGSLLAVLYALEATDLHFENLIAAGDQPVAIDLETLFHPRVPRPDPARRDERLAGRILSRSVLRVGLLPFRAGESDDFEGIDLSGVASVAGQPAPDRALQWERAGTDEMRAARLRPTMPGALNRPTLAGREVEAADYIDDLALGFERAYRVLMRHRDALLAPDGPLARFAADEVRAVLRPTRAYGLLLSESFHPDFLRDAIDRDRFFDRLWVGVEEHPALARVVAWEHADLWAGDVPCFTARVDSFDLMTGDGVRVERFFEESALAAARRRVSGLGEDDLKRQIDLLRLALGVRLLNRDDPDPPGYAPVPVGPGAISPDAIGPGAAERPDLDDALRARLVSAAAAIGDWFEQTALRDERDVTWAGLDFRNRRWSLTTASEDLYIGAPGIALFLGYLGALAGRPQATRLARGAVATLLDRLAHTGDTIPTIGAFQGWGGIVYALAHLAALWDDGALLDEAEGMTGRIAALLDRDEDLDVVGGAAGAIAALLALERAAGALMNAGDAGRTGRAGVPRSDRVSGARAVAIRCGDHLLARARTADPGLEWRTRIGGDEPQTGFSHGAAGIGWALAELGGATGERRFLEAARAAFVFERRLFWPDLRRWLGEGGEGSAGGRNARTAHAAEGPIERTVAMAWCYGAPGVGLSRLRALRHLDDDALAEEAATAVRLTAERGFGQNHCLCHGDLGNLDLLLQATGAGDPNAPVVASRRQTGVALRRQTEIVLGSIARDGWLCGTRAGVRSPGLMNGLAGIGLGLLRLAAPQRVPSVLVLDPPPGG